MPKYLSPVVVVAEVNAIGNVSGSGSDIAATTIYTTPNNGDNHLGLYEATVLTRVTTAAGGAETQAISIIATDTASARTLVVPLATEAGAYAATANANAAGVYQGSVRFRADKNTNIQYTVVHSAANAGAYDLVISIRRLK